MRPDVKDAALERVALFPLNVVLFPGGLLPLRIFEPRYQRMVAECLREQQPFAVAAILEGPEAGGVALTATTGTLALVRRTLDTSVRMAMRWSRCCFFK